MICRHYDVNHNQPISYPAHPTKNVCVERTIDHEIRMSTMYDLASTIDEKLRLIANDSVHSPSSQIQYEISDLESKQNAKKSSSMR